MNQKINGESKKQNKTSSYSIIRKLNKHGERAGLGGPGREGGQGRAGEGRVGLRTRPTDRLTETDGLTIQYLTMQYTSSKFSVQVSEERLYLRCPP